MSTRCQSCNRDFGYRKILHELWDIRGGFFITCPLCGQRHDTSMAGQIKIVVFLLAPSVWAAITVSTLFRTLPGMAGAGLATLLVTMSAFSLLVPRFSWFGDKQVGDGTNRDG